MWNKPKTRWALAIATAALLGAPTTGALAFDQQAGSPQGQTTLDFLSQAIDQQAPASAAPTDALLADDAPDFVQSAPATRNPLSVNLRGSADLSLWNLVAAVRAQQVGSSFDLIDTSLTTFQVAQIAVDPPSSVPLPPAAWLFVMGALGLAGTRITGLSGRGQAAKPEPDRHRSFGAALPA